MSEVSGFVAKIITTPWQDKTLYGFTLDGDERLFATGLDKPSFNPGVKVAFDTNKVKGRWQVKAKDVKVFASEARPAFPGKAANGKQQQDPEYWDKKDRVIERQSCRNSAIELVGILIANQAVKLPASADKKYDAVIALVDSLVERFTEDNERVRSGNAEVDPYANVTTSSQASDGLDAEADADAEEWLNS